MTEQELETVLQAALDLIRRQQQLLDELLPEESNPTATFKPCPRRVAYFVA